MASGILKESNPLWYKDAVIYEIHVKSFYDSNGDGIGDFQGLIKKLGYIENLGVTALWLLPFYPSPLKDDGYDIADYFNVHPDYGSLGDFRRFLREAHKRGIRVITELVINHTSDRHAWFQRARRSKAGSKWQDFYVWSDTPEKYADARVIFKDFEHSNWSWDPVAGAYYWHRFYSHQPDLNFDNAAVREQIFRAIDFWLEMGVDGLRLDAVPYLFEREGTNCENLPETHAFLKELRRHVDDNFTDRLLLAEANQWPEDAAAYFGDGDECHMAFHFPVMPRLFMSLQMEDRFPLLDMAQQSLCIPENCQWAMFLRNHDELTLEMVTDEERDYMYRTYARDPKARINLGIRRRLAPLLANDRRKIELMKTLLFSLPGTPVLYYGDEIGMGDNYYLGDRDGVRTPMQWSPDRNAGFSSANPQRLFLPVVIDSQYHYATVNVENQAGNISSLLWFMRRLISMRNRFTAFGRGDILFVNSDNPRVLAFIRRHLDQTILVVANLSRFCQVASLKLDGYAGWTCRELFSGNDFPKVTDGSYLLTLGAYNAYWFALIGQTQQSAQTAFKPPEMTLDSTWKDIMETAFPEKLAELLPAYLETCRWLSVKNKSIRKAVIEANIPIGEGEGRSYALLVRVSFVAAPGEYYLLPVCFFGHGRHPVAAGNESGRIIAYLHLKDGDGVLCEAQHNPLFRAELLNIIARGLSVKADENVIAGTRAGSFRKIMGDRQLPFKSHVVDADQTNTLIVYHGAFCLKIYRRLEPGLNPDVEISQHLTEYTSFKSFPRHAGSIRWRVGDQEPVVIAQLLEYIHAETDAWSYSLDAAGRYIGQRMAAGPTQADTGPEQTRLEPVDRNAVPGWLEDLIGSYYIDMVALLGQRTAQLHLALGSLTHDADVQPEPFSMLYQKAVYQSMRAQAIKFLDGLESSKANLSGQTAEEANAVLAAKQQILEVFGRITDRKISGKKIRIHGDYHLGQVLHTGKDLIIIDFEGEAVRPLGERRLKRSAVRDVAGMLQSFYNAAQTAALFGPLVSMAPDCDLCQWADTWYCCIGGVFLQSYLDITDVAEFLPSNRQDFEILLRAFLMEKAMCRIGGGPIEEPERLIIPLRAINRTLQANQG